MNLVLLKKIIFSPILVETQTIVSDTMATSLVHTGTTFRFEAIQAIWQR